ncbi:DoxX family membrane protein [Halorubrum sp. ASP1]|uniref:DoxX family protein n=1 Tax=Halorubrum sp. ASP1 TaxID=2518114 RepID=UPI0010F959B0|nr:DoxX family membrane protein [Halorubrum sp. ASP1]TKX58336.1 DoxX family membrane protein [Halorubrum sp. ASP1]
MTDADRTRAETEPDAPVEAERSLVPLMGATYVVAGIAHFLIPERFAEAVPPSFPRPVGLVYLSGVAEILLGIGVAIPRTRRVSAWGIVALLVAVFPANVHLARSETLNDLVPEPLVAPARLAALVRLPFQGVLIGWALRYARADEAELTAAEA